MRQVVTGAAVLPTDTSSPVEPSIPSHIQTIIEQVKSLALDPRALFLEDMDHYVEITDWPLAEGFRERMYADAAGETWGRGKTFAETSKEMLRAHGAWEVSLVRNDVMTPAVTLDGLFLQERKSLVNSPEAEKLARQWLANKLALEDCSHIDHIKKPKNAPANWKPRFNWELYTRINPNASRKETLSRNRALEGEINAQRAQDASFENLRARMETLSNSLDLVNG